MEMLKSKTPVRIIVLALIITMIAWLLPANLLQASAASYPKAPRTASNGTVTWDCVYFGHYPQSSNGKGGFNNDPIKWRVLSVKGNDAFLVAEKNLDVQPYNKAFKSVTWSESTIRSWLNGYGASDNNSGKDYSKNNFRNKAFNSSESKAIRSVNITTIYSEKGINKRDVAKDKIYMLATSDTCKKAHGFSNVNPLASLCVQNTEYVKNKNIFTEMKDKSTGCWWLRDPGAVNSFATYVALNGFLELNGASVDSKNIGVRPALHLNLSSKLWKDAGTVTYVNWDKPKAVTGLKVQAGKKTMTISWKKDTKVSGYQITYAQDKSFKKGKKNVTISGNKTIKKSIKSLKSNQTYYIKVRAYVKKGNSKVYGKYSACKAVKVK